MTRRTPSLSDSMRTGRLAASTLPPPIGTSIRFHTTAPTGLVVMILLDTNYLIRALIAGTGEAARVSAWIDSSEDLCTASVSWYEFLCGPVDEEGIDLMRAITADRILPFTAAAAQESARLFNAVGRRRQLRVDAMIAATAIVAGAHLATENADDFSPFIAEGLRLT